MKKHITMSVVALILLSGCATNEGPQYSGQSYSQIKQYEIGTVLEERPVVITDNGNGAFFGALIGAVLGSTMGMGSGKTLSTLGGGIGGYYAGKEIAKANGDELTVKLDNGEHVVVVVKGKIFHAGDRVKIIKDGNKVAEVSKVE